MAVRPLTGFGVPGENNVRWYYGSNVPTQGLVGRVRSPSFKASPPFFSFLLTALIDQSHSGIFLNTEMGQGSFPLETQRKRHHYISGY